ncbi:MAG: hypothetical protein V1913_07590 [Fibrobacterota bacterium]
MISTLRERLNLRALFRTVDNGRVVEIFRGDADWKPHLGRIGQVTQVTIQPEKTAGGHVHSEKREILCLLDGTLKGLFRDEATGEILDIEIAAGTLLDLSPGISHLFINTGGIPARFFEFANRPYDPENPDARPVTLGF